MHPADNNIATPISYTQHYDRTTTSLFVVAACVQRKRRTDTGFQKEAPAGGAAAAAPERGALACPSAPTSTSTRWAPVTM
jgi:hypothetical protein